MKTAIVFLETYMAAGSDTVAKAILENLSYEVIHLFINQNCDKRILKLDTMPKHIKIHYYGIVTPSTLSVYAIRISNKLLKNSIRFLNLVIRYPLIIFSIAYFYIKFKKIDYSVFISINGGYPAAEYCRSACLASSLLSKGKVFHVFFNKPTKSFSIFKFFESCYDSYLDKKVCFICDSAVNAKELNITRNINQKVKVVHNGLPIVKPKVYDLVRKQKFTILNVAIFDDRKNQIFLLEALNVLINNGYDDFVLKFIGYEAEAGYLEKMNRTIEKYHLKKYVEILTFTTELNIHYLESDIFVLSSKAESFPVVVLEALRFGLPVVSTNVGGVNEQILDGFNGFLIDSVEPEKMADKIQYFIDNYYLCRTYGANSYKYFLDNFSIQKMKDEYNLIFKDKL